MNHDRTTLEEQQTKRKKHTGRDSAREVLTIKKLIKLADKVSTKERVH